MKGQKWKDKERSKKLLNNALSFKGLQQIYIHACLNIRKIEQL